MEPFELDDNNKKIVCLLSGGLDSSVLLYNLVDINFDVYPISIFYGQRHQRELMAARDITLSLGLFDRHVILNLELLGDLLKSALTGEGDIPQGHYQAESMKQTVVPNRNLIMLSIAAGYAKSIGAPQVCYAAHAGDHAIYPDCRPEFVIAANQAIRQGTDGVSLCAPFIMRDKKWIVKLGLSLNVPFELTWTCYNGREKACGKCGSCVERLEAFAGNKATDPIEYEGGIE